MDALEFLKEYKRMCDQVDCEDCPLHSDGGCDTPIIFSKPMYSLRECVAAVEQWSKEHPRKTRQSEFLKQWPNAKMNPVIGTVDVSPCCLDKSLLDECREHASDCYDCRRKYWLQEVE